MEKGDKVILKRYEDNSILDWGGKYYDGFIGMEVEVSSVHENWFTFGGRGFAWMIDACEIISDKVKSEDSVECFYVGQTVYSPYFKNKGNVGVIDKIGGLDKSKVIAKYKELSGWDTFKRFTEEGLDENGLVSLFQEPIVYPINKPIEKPVTFEKGEMVEFSDCGNKWFLGYYIQLSTNTKYPYNVARSKLDKVTFSNIDNYAKIRKITNTN